MRREIYPIRLSKGEREDFFSLAKKEGIPLSQLIRELLYRRIEERTKGVAA